MLSSRTWGSKRTGVNTYLVYFHGPNYPDMQTIRGDFKNRGAHPIQRKKDRPYVGLRLSS